MTDALERLVLPRYPRPEDVHPPLDFPEYRSTALRHPKQPLIHIPQTLSELTLTTLYPGLAEDQVREATGWKLRVAAGMGVAEPPSQPELAALRGLRPVDTGRATE